MSDGSTSTRNRLAYYFVCAVPWFGGVGFVGLLIWIAVTG